MDKLSWLQFTEVIQKFIDERREQKAPPFDYYGDFADFLEYFCEQENIDKDQFFPNCGYVFEDGFWNLKE